jgi:hypothetical protein
MDGEAFDIGEKETGHGLAEAPGLQNLLIII